MNNNFKKYEETQSRFVARYGGDPNAKDISRVLRLAGTYNMKIHKNPFLVTAEVCNDDYYPREKILELLAEDAPHNLEVNKDAEPFVLPDAIMEGDRNDYLFRYACSLRSQGLSREHIETYVEQANAERCVSPLDKKEVKSLTESALKYPSGKNFYPSTDMRNAERFRDDWKETLLFCADEKVWYIWDGTSWVKDETKQVLEKAKVTAKKLTEDARLRTDKGAEKASKWAHGSQSATRLSSMIKLAEPDMACKSDKFNQNDMQLNLLNCIVDLKTDDIIDHDPKFYHSLTAPITFDPDADCPKFKEFLDITFQGNAEMIEYVQCMMGYILTGDTSEQCIFILLGDGRNGKSSLVNVIIELMGPYHKRANADTFLNINKSPIRSDLARLKGARVITGSEATNDKFWDEALIKDISGGEKVTARLLYENESEFLPRFKLLMAVNSLPQIKGMDGGIWRRIRILPFDFVVPKEQVDPQLGKKLKDELPGIFNFALEGLRKWRMNSLIEPELITNRVEEFRGQMDRIQAFIDERCDTCEGNKLPAKDLYLAYKEWALDSGYHPLNANNFGRHIKAKGYESSKGRHNGIIKQIYYNLILKDNFVDDE
ncbi:MAG: phage/plasmid primase, P4 family [Alphaproteobacteria bacterium]